MTAYAPDLASLLSAVSVEMKAVRFEVIEGDLLVLDGLVESNEQKHRIEQAARAAGFRLRSRLKVAPAAFDPEAVISL